MMVRCGDTTIIMRDLNVLAAAGARRPCFLDREVSVDGKRAYVGGGA